MKRGLKSALGAKDSEIMELKDVDFAQLSATMIDLNERIIGNWVQGAKKTLVLFYYAGHGIMKNYTSIVCDKAPRQAKIFYPLEKQLRILGLLRGSYVLGVFDCCRAEFTVPTRGGGNNEAGDENFDEGNALENRNCILTFGCAPSGGVDAVSTIAQEYLQHLCADTDSEGNIQFPSLDFLKWNPGNGGDHVTLFTEQLVFNPRGGENTRPV